MYLIIIKLCLIILLKYVLNSHLSNLTDIKKGNMISISAMDSLGGAPSTGRCIFCKAVQKE